MQSIFLKHCWARAGKPGRTGGSGCQYSNPHLASQIYALSVAMVDDANFMERSYLDELAKQLNLDHSLKHELETQVKQRV